MAYESPLFQSSLDLFAHSIEHFNNGTDRDRKFVILHLANAVELVFKDVLLDLGESIYKNPKETITIQGAIETLKTKNINIPKLNILELLIDERNALQHRYGFPNEVTAIFYMQAVYSFFEDFLKTNYGGLDLEEVLKEFLTQEEIATFKLREVSNEDELKRLSKLATIHPAGALLSAYAYFEKGLYDAIGEYRIYDETGRPRPMFMNPMSLSRTMRDFEIDLPADMSRKFEHFRESRNKAAHGRSEPKKEEVKEAIDVVKAIEPYLKQLKTKIEEKYKENPVWTIKNEAGEVLRTYTVRKVERENFL